MLKAPSPVDVDRVIEAEVAVIVGRGFAEGQEGVDVSGLSVDQAGLAPELWRTAVGDGAFQAVSGVAKFTVVAPKHMGGADEPVFVGCVQFDALAFEEFVGNLFTMIHQNHCGAFFLFQFFQVLRRINNILLWKRHTKFSSTPLLISCATMIRDIRS